MAEIKQSYSDLVYQVVRNASEPLPFAEIMQRVAAVRPITTKNPKSTIRNAINESRLIVNTGDERYGWKYRVINGSALRLLITESDLSQGQITYTEELREALWPSFFENQKHEDLSPIHLKLPGGPLCDLTLDHLYEANWGPHNSPEFLDWLKSTHAQPGDSLIFRVDDGEERLYSVEFQPRSMRDEVAIESRNVQIVQAALAIIQKSRFATAIWDVSPRLLATGQYKHPIPPDPLETLLHGIIWEPGGLMDPILGNRLVENEPALDLLISSLLEQVGATPRRKRAKQKLAQTGMPSLIYQLKVTLKEIRPPIWRRILVPSDISLPQLHAVLQIAMGWTNSHLHGFIVDDIFYTEPDPDDMGEFDSDDEDERSVRLSQIAPKVRAHFVYEYDFGDSWDHLITVEQIMEPEPNTQYPCCLDGKRACPPEDVGGVYGYPEFLAAIRNRDDPEHDSWLEWIGGKFDPETFDLQKVNTLLRQFHDNR